MSTGTIAKVLELILSHLNSWEGSGVQLLATHCGGPHMFLMLQVVLPITRPTPWPSLKPKSLLCDVWISSLLSLSGHIFCHTALGTQVFLIFLELRSQIKERRVSIAQLQNWILSVFKMLVCLSWNIFALILTLKYCDKILCILNK